MFANRNYWRGVVLAGLMLALALLFVAPVFAGDSYEGETIIIDEDTDDDVYAFGQEIVVDATINGDLIAFGSSLTINGTVTGDVIFAGAVLTLNGTVGDDLRAAGAVLYLGEDASVGDDFNAGAGAIEMLPGSSVGGDLYFGAGQAVIGDVAGGIAGGGEGVRIVGTVGGNADLEVGDPNSTSPTFMIQMQQYWMQAQGVEFPPISDVPPGLSFAEGGEVEGDLRYTASQSAQGVEDFVGGTTDFIQQVAEEEAGPSAALLGVRFLGHFIGLFLVALVFGVLLQSLAPKFLDGALDTLKARPLPSLGVGFLGYLVYFVLVLLFVVLLFVALIPLGVIGVGGPIARGLLLLGAGFQTFFGLSTRWLPIILFGLLLGGVLYGLVNKERKAPFWSLVIGVFLIAFVLAIPIVGRVVVGGVLSLFALGAVILYLWPRKQAGEPAAAADAPSLDAPPAV
jgi:hypothetical protein